MPKIEELYTVEEDLSDGEIPESEEREEQLHLELQQQVQHVQQLQQQLQQLQQTLQQLQQKLLQQQCQRQEKQQQNQEQQLQVQQLQQQLQQSHQELQQQQQQSLQQQQYQQHEQQQFQQQQLNIQDLQQQLQYYQNLQRPQTLHQQQQQQQVQQHQYVQEQPQQQQFNQLGGLQQISQQNIDFNMCYTETGKALGPNQKGEVFTRGPQVMEGDLQQISQQNTQVPQEGVLQVIPHQNNIQESQEDALTYRLFRIYRNTHPGPVTQKAFRFWKMNGCKDKHDFNYVDRQRNKKKGARQVILQQDIQEPQESELQEMPQQNMQVLLHEGARQVILQQDIQEPQESARQVILQQDIQEPQEGIKLEEMPQQNIPVPQEGALQEIPYQSIQEKQEALTSHNFKKYRKTHPGPTTKNAFRFWRLNGGKDKDNFDYVECRQKTKRSKRQKIKLNDGSTFTAQLIQRLPNGKCVVYPSYF